MADIRKRVGKKGTTYQVRYPSKTVKSGYAFATFTTMKAARAFTQNLGSLAGDISTPIKTVPQAGYEGSISFTRSTIKSIA